MSDNANQSRGWFSWVPGLGGDTSAPAKPAKAPRDSRSFTDRLFQRSAPVVEVEEEESKGFDIGDALMRTFKGSYGAAQCYNNNEGSIVDCVIDRPWWILHVVVVFLLAYFFTGSWLGALVIALVEFIALFILGLAL